MIVEKIYVGQFFFIVSVSFRSQLKWVKFGHFGLNPRIIDGAPCAYCVHEGLRYGTVVASAASTCDQTHAWEFAASSWDPSDFSAAILFVHRVLYRIIMVIKTQTIITLTTETCMQTREFNQTMHLPNDHQEEN